MTRKHKVDRAAKQWCNDLTDVSGRNRLLYYRNLKVGTLGLSDAAEVPLRKLLEGKPGTKVKLSSLFNFSGLDIYRLRPGLPVSDSVMNARDKMKRARAVSRKALENFEERGVHTLYLAQGFVTWTPQSSKSQPAAPVLMCAASLHRRGASETDFDLSLDGEWTVNEALLHYLAREFNVRISGEELLGSKLSDARLDNDEVEEIFADLRLRASRILGFQIEPRRLILGNFLYKKMPMVNDILSNLDVLTDHDLIAALAGVEEARRTLRSEHSQSVDIARPDTIPPADEYLVLDADSTQNQAINAALAGESYVLQGPPGTGKSQTISNLISTMMARGKSVLFVAEKRAAIDAVFKRLNKTGLGDFVMDLHGGTVRRRELARQLDQSLSAIGQTPPIRMHNLHQVLEDSRSELSGYAKALHQERRPWGLSFFDVQERLLEIRSRNGETGRADSRVSGRAVMRISAGILKKLDRTKVRLLRDDLVKWAELSAPFLSDQPSPWANATVTTPKDVMKAQDVTLELVLSLSDTWTLCSEMLTELRLPYPGDLADWNSVLVLLTDISTAGTRPDPDPLSIEIDQMSRDLFTLISEHQAAEQVVAGITREISEHQAKSADRKETDHHEIQQLETNLGDAGRIETDLLPAEKGGTRLVWARMFSSRYRAARNQVGVISPYPKTLADREILEIARDISRKALLSLESFREQSRLHVEKTIKRSNHLRERLRRAAEEESDLNRKRRSLEEAKQQALGQWEDVKRDANQWDLDEADRLRRWKRIGGQGFPRVPSDLARIQVAFATLSSYLAELASVLPSHGLERLTLDGMAEKVDALEADLVLLNRMPDLSAIERRIKNAGIGRILQQARQGVAQSSELATTLDEAWLTAIRRQVLLTDSRLGSFENRRQDRLVDDFRRDDSAHLRNSSARVRRKVAEHAVRICNTHRNQNDLVRREAAKKTRHLPLRRLFEKAPDVLTAIRPCWAMSPLDVAQTLPAKPLFDLVVFDEASQVLPCDAICALSRGRRVVIAGDPRQLPPTVFFDGAGGDSQDEEYDEDAGALADYESILDVMGAMLSRRLITWHYRSQDERLIAFANRNIYHGTLTTFPGADTDQCVRFELVHHRPGQNTDTRSNPSEVRRVVELMIRHARERPEESLGVIAMGRYHADRIEQRLRYRLREENAPALEEFFDEEAEERAFVKNLERVQGDERDAIILTVGYGKDANGRLLYRFGPLNMAGGERRLNVAITRARRRMTLVASFSHADMDPARSSAQGVQQLFGYLKYAESGGTELAGASKTTPLNAFELDVFDKLTDAGLKLVPQYGCSGYRIDFAVRHPTQPGRFVLAVEADGASYHSSHTARDRDRLRQEHLERLGWRFCRIWSTNWFTNHGREVKRVLAMYRESLNVAESGRTDYADEGHCDDVLPSGMMPTPQQRGPRPLLTPRQPIYEYDPDLLLALARWVMSDGCLRTDDQIFEEMFQQLGYRRRGPRIKEALHSAITEAKRST